MSKHAGNLGQFFSSAENGRKKYSSFGLKIKDSYKGHKNSKNIAIWLHVGVVLVQLYYTLLFEIY